MMSTRLRQVSTLSGCIIVLFYSQFALAQPAQYQTFGFNRFEATVLSPYQLVHLNKENAQYVRSLVMSELETYGMSLSNNPDLLVNIRIDISHVLQPREVKNSRKWMPAHSKEKEQYIIQEGVYAKVGTISIEFEDPANNSSIVWEGSRSIALWGKNEKTLMKNTRKAVTKILKRFDPSQKGQN